MMQIKSMTDKSHRDRPCDKPNCTADEEEGELGLDSVLGFGEEGEHWAGDCEWGAEKGVRNCVGYEMFEVWMAYHLW